MEPTYQFARIILKPWLAAWFRWTIEGDEHIPSSGPAILAFNHIAFLDPFAAAYVVDRRGRRPRFLAKSELFQDKRIAWILKGAAQIEVKRGSRDAPMALDHAFAALERGEIIVVFPEGTITDDPNLSPMAAKTGTARLALGSGAPVVPCALWGTANIWPKGYAKRWWPPKQDVLVRLGEPMRVSGDPDSSEDWQRISLEVMERIGGLVASLRPVVPDRRRPGRKKAA
ncbi:MAG: 1-acyl-sn-glycerol-3-phosphate acyltransferase [Actinomycetota bacterium]|nr:1-acyl-sn-glycerol-3-phosphate acyltransferase [Actinomycetota bacterium]